MSAIQERGLQVGRHIAVGGFDDVPLAEHIHPGLTTIHQPIHEAGQRVTQIILRKISGQSVDDCTALITPELIIRASSGPRRS
jgi:LacI family transcriptional regulator